MPSTKARDPSLPPSHDFKSLTETEPIKRAYSIPFQHLSIKATCHPPIHFTFFDLLITYLLCQQMCGAHLYITRPEGHF